MALSKEIKKATEIKLNEMLLMIYASLSSNVTSDHYKMSSQSSAYTFLGEENHNISFKSDFFTQTVENKDMSLRFKINISRSKRANLFGVRRYISSIEVISVAGYTQERIYIDTKYYKSTYKVQKSIFDFLITYMDKKTITDETSKFDKYLSELKKSVNKQVLRDDKLDELLK